MLLLLPGGFLSQYLLSPEGTQESFPPAATHGDRRILLTCRGSVGWTTRGPGPLPATSTHASPSTWGDLGSAGVWPRAGNSCSPCLSYRVQLFCRLQLTMIANRAVTWHKSLRMVSTTPCDSIHCCQSFFILLLTSPFPTSFKRPWGHLNKLTI